MHDTGPGLAADRQHAGPAMGDQGVHQRAVEIAGGRMHHQPRLLVDDDQILVFVNHLKRDILALRNGRRHRRHRHREIVVRFDPVVGVFYRPALLSGLGQ